MAGTSKAVKSAAELLADRADVAASWVTGPRAAHLRQLAEDIRGLGSGDTERVLAQAQAEQEAAEAARAQQEAAEAARKASEEAAAKAAKENAKK